MFRKTDFIFSNSTSETSTKRVWHYPPHSPVARHTWPHFFLARARPLRAMVSSSSTLGDNVGLVAAVIAVVVAQVLKPFSDWTVTGKFKAGLAVGSGGFPSSHSSLVTALATGAGYQSGLGDPAFATALVLALVVRHRRTRVTHAFPTPIH